MVSTRALLCSVQPIFFLHIDTVVVRRELVTQGVLSSLGMLELRNLIPATKYTGQDEMLAHPRFQQSATPQGHQIQIGLPGSSTD